MSYWRRTPSHDLRTRSSRSRRRRTPDACPPLPREASCLSDPIQAAVRQSYATRSTRTQHEREDRDTRRAERIRAIDVRCGKFVSHGMPPRSRSLSVIVCDLIHLVALHQVSPEGAAAYRDAYPALQGGVAARIALSSPAASSTSPTYARTQSTSFRPSRVQTTSDASSPCPCSGTDIPLERSRWVGKQQDHSRTSRSSC
jgi:hypothetical protein